MDVFQTPSVDRLDRVEYASLSISVGEADNLADFSLIHHKRNR